MNQLLIVLACLVGIAAAGILDRSILLSGQTDDGRIESGTKRILDMSQEQLLRQKFLLDVLLQVQQPLIIEELLELGQTLIVDPSKYVEHLDDEILYIIELCRQQQLLSNQEIFRITNEDHLRQMIGLYRMLVRSLDWDTFQRNVCYARGHINGELFVNALLLAVRDREDTRMLIIPAIYEILPEQFYDEELLRKAQNFDLNLLVTERETFKPTLLDLIGIGRRQRLQQRNQLISGRIGGAVGEYDVLNTSKLWLPWRELHLEMALRRAGGENTKVLLRNQDKLVLPVERRAGIGEAQMSLLTDDIGFNGYLYNLINDLVLNEADLMRERQIKRIGLSVIDDDEEDDERLDTEEGKREESIDSDRLLRAGRRRQNIRYDDREQVQDEEQENTGQGRGTLGLGKAVRQQESSGGQYQGQYGTRQVQQVGGIKRTNIYEDQQTTDFDNERILRIGRRRQVQTQNQDEDIDDERLSQKESISDGRRIDELQQRNQDQRQYKRGRKLKQNTRTGEFYVDNDEDERILGIGQRRQMIPELNRDQGFDDEQQQQYRGRQGIKQYSKYQSIRPQFRRNQLVEDETDDLPTTTIDDQRLLHINRRRYQQGQARIGIDNERDRFLNIIQSGSRWISEGRRTKGGRIGMELDEQSGQRENIDFDDDEYDSQLRGGQIGRGKKQLLDNQQRIRMRGNRRLKLDTLNDDRSEMQLPSTTIDDQRLLRVNRRRLNQRTIDNDDLQEEEDEKQRIGERYRVQSRGNRNINEMNMIRDQRRRSNIGLSERRRYDENDDDDDEKQQQSQRDINDERILRVNRRRLQNQPIEDKENFFQTLQRGIRASRRILGRTAEHDDDEERRDDDRDDDRNENRIDDRNEYERERIDNDRLLKINRRRAGMKRLGEDRRRIGDEQEEQLLGELSEQRRVKYEARGMEDMGEQQQRIDSERLQNDAMSDDERILVTGRRRRIEQQQRNEQSTQGRQRNRRSLRMKSYLNEERQSLQRMYGGELLLHNLQQLAARINVERISLGLREQQLELEDTEQKQQGQRIIGAGARFALRLNNMRLETRRNRQLLQQINAIEERLRSAFATELRVQKIREPRDINRIIGNVLLGGGQQGSDNGLLQILRELQTDNTQSLPLLRDPIMQQLLRRIVQLIDEQHQQLGGDYERQDIALDGVRINDIRITDKLRTYVDVNDADLINLLDQRLTLQKDQVLQKMLVARQQRLNHKPFELQIDVSAERAQRVEVRTLLLPRIDAADRELSLDEARVNALLLDVAVVQLQAGKNLLRRKSRDISWTTRDTTAYSEIYQRIMQAIEGRLDVQLNQVVGNNYRFPHRLLLPRGRVRGLPMQLLVVLSSVQQADNQMQQLQDFGLSGIGVDNLQQLDSRPLGFPLDRRIDNGEQLIQLPNLMLKDVKIYHDERVRADL